MVKNKFIYIVSMAIGILFLACQCLFAQTSPAKTTAVSSDTTGVLPYPFEDEGEFQYPDQLPEDPLYLNSPSNIERKIEYDPITKEYVIYEKIGNLYYRMPKSMGLKEYIKYDFDQSIKDYWRTRKETEALATGEKNGSLIPQLKIESEAFSNIFGSDVIDIQPQGYVEVTFGVQSVYNGNPSLSERQKRTTSFDFDNQINMSIKGKIGDKVNMQVNYNTEATFDFENQMKLDYAGKEDEILKKLEAGNVSLPLNGSLIQGGTNLFGVKAEMQFGKLNLTTIVSQNKGESQTIETEGGAQKTEFEIKASDYDENRHFFLSKYFRDNFNTVLKVLPTINTQVTVNKIEVWVTNKTQNFTDARDIIAFVDLGEQEANISNDISEFGAVPGLSYPENKIPHNGANYLYQEISNTYSGVRDSKKITKTMAPLVSRGFDEAYWQKVNQARKLSSSEYTINEELGFISLNSALNNNEVLAVAYNITINDSTYQVGEFATDNSNSEQTLILKLLKGSELSPGLPTWNLMMKNIYNLGAYDLSSDDFNFNVVYKNDSTDTYVSFLPADELKNTTLLRVMNLDNLNTQLDYVKGGDGKFDFIEGVTVTSSSGRIMFPVLEPFGSNLTKKISSQDQRETYVFSELYDSTKTKAEEAEGHDKFYMVGSFKGTSSSEISLNTFNLTEGSIVVYAGSTKLVENTDYTVDYALGKVKIINEAYINSQTPITVSTESSDLISMQRKTMVGAYASYAASDKLNIGGTLLYMNERSITNKVDVGEEPVSNLMLGLDFQYHNKSQFLTNLVNLLPFYESKTASSISVEGEVAKLITGSSSSTNNCVYIDDFEGVESTSSYSNAHGWKISSTPKMFKEAEKIDDLASNYNRASLAWYTIDRTLLVSTSSTMPSNIKADLDMRSNHYMRSIGISEIFPGKELTYNSVTYQNTLDLAYFPKERGPYNFDVQGSAYSSGIDEEGNLKDPASRWGGVMRNLETTDLEAANTEYIEFWLLDPFLYDDGTNTGGDLYFNLGNISEDVLKDSYLAFENGLPETDEVTDVDTTSYGRVSNQQMLKQVFSSSTETSRNHQDIGFDGLNDTDEKSFFSTYLDKAQSVLNSDAYDKILADPSNDDFHYFKGDDYDEEKLNIIDRYKKYNGFEGNTPINTGSTTTDASSTNEPDIEDLNSDNTLNETDGYYQYKVSIRPEDLVVGKNYIVDKITSTITNLPNDKTSTATWYQFRVPIDDPDKTTIGKISGFKSIQFFRMFLTNFSDSVILRFGTLGLVSSSWKVVDDPTDLTGSSVVQNSSTQFEMSTINIEENASRKPINYILPPGIEREVDPTSTTAVEMNEQSMVLKVEDLSPGDIRAVYRDVGVDMRQYKNLKMEVHAEAIEGYELNDYETSLIIRLGSDYDNYYEYEVPLKLTPVPSTPYVGGDNLYSSDRYIVWPDENRINIDLSIFPELKEDRDAEMSKTGSKVTRSTVYEEVDEDSEGEKNIIRVKGNPSIGEVELIHIGILNPAGTNSVAKSVEVWVNELRMSDIEQKGGWASTGRVNLQLADLGNVSLSGRTESVGWGSISETASERNLESKYQYELASNIELGKLLPAKLGAHIPVYYNYSNAIENPEYNPLSTDITMEDALAALDTPEEKAYLKSISQDVATRESFTLNNITIEPERKKDRKPLPTDIENFSASYSYTKEDAHNIDVVQELETVQKASLDYNYSITSKSIEPFKKIKFLDNDFLRIIKDFNFSPLPELISYSTDMVKEYSQEQARDNSGLDIDLPVTVSKDFLWNRNFDFRWNLTRNLKFDFTNTNVNRIDELDGIEDKDLYPELYKQIQQELWTQLKSFGRPVDYEHTVDIQYTVPINKLPLLDFTSLRTTYKGSYEWSAGAQLDTTEYDIELGNTIVNGMNFNATAQLNMLTLYNKVPYFKKINQKFQSQTRKYGSKNKPDPNKKDPKAATKEKEGKSKEVKFEEKKVAFKANIPKSIFHKLGTEKVTILVISAKGDTIEGTTTIVNENRINFKTEKNVADANVYVTGRLENVETFGQKALERTTKFLLGVQSLRASYTLAGGTEMPGFLGEPQAFHFGSEQFSPANGGASSLAPGIPFLLGWQDENFGLEAAKNGWITEDTTILKQFLCQNTETWNFGITFEPIPNVKIDISGSRRESTNNSSYIQYNHTTGNFDQYSKKETGNFDMSILTIATAFKESLSDTLQTAHSTLFDKFRYEARPIIKARLNAQRGYVPGVGYSKNAYDSDTTDGVSDKSSDVIIPALIATYSGIDPAKIPLTARPGLRWIRPNWKINYTGDPKNISWMKDIITSFNLTHSYKSTYAIGKYETNLDYSPDATGLSWVRNELDTSNYFIPQLDVTSVTIQENFSPLINIDIGFKNDLSTSFEISKSRILSFSFSNMQLSEMIKNEYTIGIGYRFTGMDMIIKTKRKSEDVSNDVNLRLDVSSENYKTTFRKIDDEKGIIQSGTQLISFDIQADYMVSDKLTVKLYYNYKFTNPYTTDSYLQKESEFGLSFNYSIM